MDRRGQITPPGQPGPGRPVDSWEISSVVVFRDGRVYSVRDRDQAGDEESRSPLGPLGKIINHFRQRPADWVGHIDIAHGRHDDPVFQFTLSDLTRCKYLFIPHILLLTSLYDLHFSPKFSLIHNISFIRNESLWVI